MNDPHDTAAKALAKCAAYDPWFPQPNRATVQAWAEQIERYRIDLPDVLDGVTKMYADHGSGFRPLPKDLVDAARAVRRDRSDRASDRSDFEALCDSKAVDSAALAGITRRVGITVGRSAEPDDAA